MGNKRIVGLIIVLLLALFGLGIMILIPSREKQDQVLLWESVELAQTVVRDIADVANKKNEHRLLPEDHVYSHRGASGEVEEHSFEAYDLAISYGSKNIEQDVVTSKSGTLYVSHDASAERLTDTDRRYKDMSDDEIDSLRTWQGNHVLKLSEVFDRYGESVNYIIELKTRDENAVNSFRKLVDRYGNQKHIVVQCFSLDVLREVEDIYPKMQKLFLCKRQEEFELGCQKDYVDILSVSKELMSKKNCDYAHKLGKQFNVWVLNSRAEIKRAMTLGVDTYFTDDTERAIELEKETDNREGD